MTPPPPSQDITVEKKAESETAQEPEEPPAQAIQETAPTQQKKTYNTNKHLETLTEELNQQPEAEKQQPPARSTRSQTAHTSQDNTENPQQGNQQDMMDLMSNMGLLLTRSAHAFKEPRTTETQLQKKDTVRKPIRDTTTN